MKKKNHEIENWKSCKLIPSPSDPKVKICQNATGWLPRDAKITVIQDKIIRPTTDPRSGDKINEEYFKIQFEYWRDLKLKDGTVARDRKTGYGYIPSSFVSNKDRSAFYQTKEAPRSSSNKVCGTDGKCVDAKIPEEKDPLLELLNTRAAKERVNNLSIVTTSDIISKLVGECSRQDKLSISRLDPKVKNTFDHFVLPKLKLRLKSLSPKEKSEFSKLKDETGIPVETNHIIEIDALARTMFAEMGRCYRKGLQYPMAVARIVRNRADATCLLKNAVFIQGQHASGKSDLTKVATSARQFNLWMKSEGKRKGGPLLQALCPPKSKDIVQYTGNLPPDSDLAIWRNSVRIATETVLYPRRFKRRTEVIEGRYYYTSGIGKFYDLEKINKYGLKIDGRELSDEGCMEIWRDIAKDWICNDRTVPPFDRKHPGKKPSENRKST